MKLYVWTSAKKSTALSALSPVFGGNADFPVEVVQSFTEVPDGAICLALGTEPKEVLEAVKAVPKGRTITKLRGHLIKVQNRQILLSYSPGIVDKDHGMYVDLICDARLALRLVKTGKLEPEYGQYKYVDDFSEMIEEIKAEYAKTGKPVDCCHDTETIGADPLHQGDDTRPASRFVCWQWSHKRGVAFVRYFHSREDFDAALQGPLYEQVKWLFTTPMISHRLANGKFDMMWHWFHTRRPGEEPHMECTNFKFDTVLVGSLLDENRSNSLKLHARVYTEMGGYADEMENGYDKERMDLVPKEVMLKYAGGDTDVGVQVADEEKKQLTKDKKLTAFYVNVLHPASRAFEVIERGGVFIDMEEYEALEADLRKELEETSQKAIEIIGGRLFAKHKNEAFPGGINLMKASLLTDFMFSTTGLGLKPKMVTEKTQAPSTALDHLLMFKDHPDAGPFVALLDDYGSTSKTLSTYVIGFKEHIRSDGRFHPSYFLHKGDREQKDGGTVTGRLSAKNPAFQTIPKHTKWGKRLRRVFKAPPGFVILEADYSQGELRVVACIANELVMIEAYRNGMDLHVKTGGAIAGLSYSEMLELKKTDKKKFDLFRQQAKPANFGLLYGQLAPGFRDYAESNYGVKLTMEQAEDIRTKFFETYVGLTKYHEDYKELAHKFGQVVSPLGRVRHLPHINAPNKWTQLEQERMAINSPVQSTLSDMMIWALAQEWQMGIFNVAPAFGMIHDAQYAYLPEDDAVKYALIKKDVMENLPLEKVGWKPQLKFIADVKIGPNMADLKDVEVPEAKAA